MLASESFLNGNETAMHQYQNICRIRAIEASKFLFKSSNSGLSSVIDEKGNVLSSKKANNKLELLKWKGYTNDIHTFYSTWGWLINKAPIVALTLLLLNLLFKKKLVYLHLGNWN
jgi:apolipoprotein N-acyltransferase